MNNLQTYINRYDAIIKNLGYSGEATEVLKQLLANATYISEVEHAAYMQEASIEKSLLMNSKIQHCVDTMYSVFRGSCPRVVMKLKPTKYITLNPFDVLIESQNFRVYYLGYFRLVKVEDSGDVIIYGEVQEEEVEDNYIGDEVPESKQIIDRTDGDRPEVVNGYIGSWEFSSATFEPIWTDTSGKTRGMQIIKAFIAPKRTGESLEINKTFNYNNTYYVDCIQGNLSDDVYIELDGKVETKTRLFSEHILNHKIFDLTLPDFGSRIYVANYYKDTVTRDSASEKGIEPNSNIKVKYFGYSTLSDYNENELYRLQVKGAELIAYDTEIPEGEETTEDLEFLRSEMLETSQAKGICFIDAVPRDTLTTIHYKANRERYANSILRSNSDIGTVLEETYPEVVKSEGTSYRFQGNSNLFIYYIPKNDSIFLTPAQINTFVTEKRAYYIITDEISVQAGDKILAYFNINLELFQNSGDVDYNEEIGVNILESNYEKKFNIIFDDAEKKYIESLISKISNVKSVKSLSITYQLPSGDTVSEDILNNEAYKHYFDINYSITTSVTLS